MEFKLRAGEKNQLKRISIKVDKAVDKYLNKSGRYIQRVVKSTIGKGRNKPRKPGQPMSYRNKGFVFRDRETGRWVDRLTAARRARSMVTNRKAKTINIEGVLRGSKGRYKEAVNKLFTVEKRKTGLVKNRIGWDRLGKTSVIIGAAGNDSLAPIFRIHEYGGTLKGKNYPARPYISKGYVKAITQPGYQRINEQTLGKVLT